MQANSSHHKFSTSICPFESGKCGKEGKKLQKFEYHENEKNFFDEIKNIFYSFWRDIISWKNKKLIKNNRHKLLLGVTAPTSFKAATPVPNKPSLFNFFSIQTHCFILPTFKTFYTVAFTPLLNRQSNSLIHHFNPP